MLWIQLCYQINSFLAKNESNSVFFWWIHESIFCVHYDRMRKPNGINWCEKFVDSNDIIALTKRNHSQIKRNPLIQKGEKEAHVATTTTTTIVVIYSIVKNVFSHIISLFIYFFFFFDFRNANFLQFGERIKLIRTHVFFSSSAARYEHTATLDYLSHAFIYVCVTFFFLITVWLMCTRKKKL